MESGNKNNAKKATLNKRLILLMSVASGLTAANLYYIQPLLAEIAQYYHVTQGYFWSSGNLNANWRCFRATTYFAISRYPRKAEVDFNYDIRNGCISAPIIFFTKHDNCIDCFLWNWFLLCDTSTFNPFRCTISKS